MQPQKCFVSSACSAFLGIPFGHTSGHHWRVSGRYVQKTEGKREKATVSLTIAFFNQRNGPRPLWATPIAHRTIDQKSIEHNEIRNGVASFVDIESIR